MFLIRKIRNSAVKLFCPLRSAAPFLAIAVAVLSSAQARAIPQQAQQQVLSPGTVSGHVLRSDSGGPLPKATVTLNIAQVNTATSQILPQIVRTDSSGAYQFTQVAPGKYTVRAEHNEFVPAGYGEDPSKQIPPTPIVVNAGQNLIKIDITLGAAGIISGTITDDDNDPVENVQVSAIRVRYARGGARQEVSVRSVPTDDQGNYRLFGLIPGFYYVRAFSTSLIGANQPGGTGIAPTYYPGTGQADGAQRIQVAAASETPGIRFSISSQVTHKITGTVIDTAAPSESRRAMIQLSYASNPGGTVQIGNASNQDGSFSLNAVPPGDYILSARSVNIGQQPNPSSGPPEINAGFTHVRVFDSDVQVNVAITGPSEIKGRITVAGTQSPPVQSVRVSLQSLGGGGVFGGGGQNVVTDPNGNFDIRGVGQGEYNFNAAIPSQTALYLKQVTCASKDYSLQPLTIESPLTLSDCVVTLGADAGSISGQVMDNAVPVPGLVILAIPETRALRSIARYVITARTDDNGQFTLAGVIPGDYLVYAVQYNDEQSYFAPDFADTNVNDAERVTVHASESKTVNPKPPAIH
jgi:protocatechuate 3,4-dioxygenase beta subunit